MWKAWLMYTLFGLFVSPLAFTDVPRPVFTTVVGLSAMFFIGMAVIADFAVMVMAPGDDEVLFHRPVNSQTYLAARVTVAGMHVSILALCYGAIPSLATLRYGEPLFVPLSLLALVAIALLSLLVTFWIYRIGLSWLGGARLQSALTYAPAFFSIITFLVPQLLIRGTASGASGNPSAFTTLEAVLSYLPPAWFFSVAEVLLGDFSPVVLSRAAIGVAVLPIGYWVLVRAMGRGFLTDLQRLLATRGTEADETGRVKPVAGAWLKRAPSELRAGYLLYTGAMRSRDSRTRAAPILLMPLALVLLGFMRPISGAGFSYALMAVYLLAAGAGTLLAMSVFHEHHKAAWFYGAAPVRRYGQFFMGIVSAMLTRQILPMFAITFMVLLIVDPDWVTAVGAIHAFAGGCLSIPFLGSFVKDPPFSRAFDGAEQTAHMGVYFLSMMIVAATAGVHVLVVLFAPAIFLFTVPALVLICWFWLRAVAKRLDEWPPEPVGPPIYVMPSRPTRPPRPRRKRRADRGRRVRRGTSGPRS